MLNGGLRFPSVAALLEFLPDKERALTEQLRELIISEAPDLKERLSFNVPFYKGRRDVCFLWPASVLWGKTKTYEGGALWFELWEPGTRLRALLATWRAQAGVLAGPHQLEHVRRSDDQDLVTHCDTSGPGA